ncbi:MAG: class I SAM-dependent methyltransferase [Bryobacteraceae bacterium]|nr:class I SAM-dependent methyltransferase [Bryobacteraceae bacterium]
MLRYRVSEDLSTSRFLVVGKASARNLEILFDRSGLAIRDCRRVLDFGCGCGRTLRWLVDSCPAVEFWGSDVDAEAINWNSDHLSPARFVVNKEWPPLPFPSNHFDAVYGISVFSHLDGEHQAAWAQELARVLRPGGALVLTLHGPKLDPTGDEKGEGCGVSFRRTNKLKGIHPDWYQTSFNAEEFTSQLLRQVFSVVMYERDGFGYQDAVFCRR